MKVAAVLVVASIALVGCTQSPAPPLSRPLVQFLEAGGMDWMNEYANATGVRLELSGIHAIDGRVAFVFGGLEAQPGTLRSVLLRTADGGETWQEVMTPVTASKVQFVAFANRELGWALAAWTVEGPGRVVLHGSDSSGRAWTQLADIPRSSTWSYPVSMTFDDPSNGEIGLSHGDIGNPDDPPRVELLATTDGGYTWQTTRRLPAEEAAIEEPPRLFATTCSDGSAWELDLGDMRNPHIVIRRRARPEDEWILVSTLPTRFSFTNGHVFAASAR